ncbi:MAG: hypothetical protein HYR51_11560 [Candidatus Rokubacteria bacterium]|nr:hypothetical protein [Candidatus Rokubacteria bacterium]
MRATITTRSLQLIGCAANPTAAGARARLFGFFFNAGDSILASLVNEVFAGVQVARFSNSTDPAGVFRIAAFTGMCSDENCFTSVSLGGVELGTVALNTPAAVQMTWDAANNRFTFQLNATTPVHLPYTVADTFPAAFPSKRIEVSNTVPRCTATTRPVSFLRADFDNVMVNTSALSARAPTLAAPADATMMEPDGDEMIGRVD